MSVQVIKVDRLTAEVLSKGYIHATTRESEASATAAWVNMENTDPSVGYLVVNTEADLSDTEAMRKRISYATSKNTLGFNSNFDAIRLGNQT